MASDPDKTPQRWETVERRIHADCKVFKVMRHYCRHPRSQVEDDFYVITALDWVVALALTPERELVMVNQYRFGTEDLSWEFPAGIVEPGEDPVAAGVRELREESGFVGENPRLIGCSYPNPAVQSNTCHYILVENAEPRAEVEWGLHEEMEIATMSVESVFEHARTGCIDHALVINALFYFRPHWDRIGAES